METSPYVVLLITTATVEEAQRISKVLLEQRKIACVNIVPRVNSLFWWQDKLDSAEESLLIVKTKASLLNEIVPLVKEIHSYDIPELIALPIIGGNQDYLEWILKEVR
jgi:periplasmic divalent cation tolerance protein